MKRETWAFLCKAQMLGRKPLPEAAGKYFFFLASLPKSKSRRTLSCNLCLMQKELRTPPTPVPNAACLLQVWK